MASLFHRRPPPVPVGTYTTWTWPPTASGYREFRWDLEPRTDPSPAGYFWSHQVSFAGGEAAYFGLQTCGSEPNGKIAIFSVWGAMDAEGPEYAAPFGGEGTGMSVRTRYEWAPGRREQLAVTAEGDAWWRAEVGGKLVGRIRARAGWGALAASSIMWTERYAPPFSNCAEIGHSVAWFGAPLADGGVRPHSHVNHLASHRGCPGSAVHDEGDGVVHIMGAGGGRTPVAL